MPTPIIYYHTGNSYYLKYSLKQTKRYNPSSCIYLLGDESNNKYSFVNHFNINKYEAGGQYFSKVYVHRSTNEHAYELMCFKRWFCIKDFCEANNINSFFYLDSDVLVYENLSSSDIISDFKHAEVANAGYNTGVPSLTYFKDYNSLEKFCNYLIDSYTKKILINRINNWYKLLFANTATPGGVCDMTLFHFYFQDYPNITQKINVIKGKLVVDTSINTSDGYEMNNGIKKVFWSTNKPYCKHIETHQLIRFINLHFQGSSKKLMYKYYKGGGYLKDRLLEFFDLYPKYNHIYERIRFYMKRCISYFLPSA